MRNRLHSEAEIEQMLNKYLRGSLSNADKRILDKYALDDPFLMEAMEGYIDEGTDLRDGELKKLREAIVAPKETKQRVISLKFLRWAAVFLGLAFVGTMAYHLSSDKATNVYVAHEASKKETIQVAEALPSAAEKDPIQVTSDEEADDSAKRLETKPEKLKSQRSPSTQDGTKKRQTTPPAIEINKEEKVDDQTEIAEEGIKDLEDRNVISNTSYVIDGIPVSKSDFENTEAELSTSAGEVKKDENQDIIDVADEDINEAEHMRRGNIYIPPKKEKADSAKKLTGSKSSNRIIAVKVVDENGEALIGANIIAGREGALSNLEGYAMLEIDTSVQSIEVSYVGYEAGVRLLTDTSSFYKVTLAESAVLDEVVVTDYSLDKVSAAPEGGWNAFETYADQQLQSMQNVDQSTGLKRGDVVVQFRINASGEVSEFTVIQSLDEEYDRAVIDMIKSYGKWLTNPPETSTYTTFKYQY